MNKKAALTQVIRQRGFCKRHKTIAEQIALTHNVDYNYALRFVQFVEANYRRRIAIAQIPIVWSVGLIFLMAATAAPAGMN